jgi:cold shock CspA family protein
MKYIGEVVKFKDKAGGYGFIRTEGPQATDVFFYYKYLLMPGYKTVAPGTRVEFELGENHRGKMAIKIQVLMFPDGTAPDYMPESSESDNEDV